MDIRTEMNAELSRARKWLLIVGVIMFVMDLVYIHVVYGDRLPSSTKNSITALSAGILAIFVALWWFAQKKPRLCLILGLVVFWGLQLYNASQDGTSIFSGILLKVLFTSALIKGLKSANRAEVLREELTRVFE
jgi:hypothetical protein